MNASYLASVRKSPATRLLGSIAVLAVGTLAVANRADASLLVYEGYNYTTLTSNGSAMSGKTPTGSGAIGLTGNYATGVTGITYNDTGLSFSNLQVSGGKINITGATGTLGAMLNTSATGTIFASYLVNFSAAPSTNSSATVGLNSPVVSPPTPATTAPGSGRYFNIMADAGAATVTTPGLGYAANATASSDGPALTAGTFFLIAQLNNVGVTLSAGSPGNGNLWVLTAAQFDYFNANGGLSTTALNAASEAATGANTVFSAYAGPNSISGSFTFDTTKALQLVLAPNSGVTYSIDEIRFGTTIGDVAPVTAVPEPSTYALGAGLIVLAGAALKRRRSKQG